MSSSPAASQVEVALVGAHTAEIEHPEWTRLREFVQDVLFGDKQLVLGAVRHHVNALALDHAGKDAQMGRSRNDHAGQAPDEQGVDGSPSRVAFEQLAAD
jgi:hypothetical protein